MLNYLFCWILWAETLIKPTKKQKEEILKGRFPQLLRKKELER